MPVHHSSPALLVALLFASAQSSGCLMAFQTNDARKFEPFPPAEISAPSAPVALHVDVSCRVTGRETTVRALRRLSFRIEDQAIHLAEQTGVFQHQTDAQAADYKLELHVHQQVNRNQSVGRFALSLFTVFLIPSIEGDRYTTDVRLVNARGDELASKQYRHKLDEVIQFFLLLGLPLRQWPDRVGEKMWQRVLQDVSVWAATEVGRAADTHP